MTEIATTSGARSVGLLSVGAYRPERVVTNDEICQHIDSSDEWIYTRTGIKTRRFAADDESAASMATEACRRALSNAGLSAADIDGVIVTTNTHSCKPRRPPQWSRRRWAPRAYSGSIFRRGAPDSDMRLAQRPT